MSAASATRRNAVLLTVLLSLQLLIMSGSVQSDAGASTLESVTVRLTAPFVEAAHVWRWDDGLFDPNLHLTAGAGPRLVYNDRFVLRLDLRLEERRDEGKRAFGPDSGRFES